MKTKRWFRNDDASIAGIFYFFLFFALIAFTWILSSGIVQEFSLFHNSTTQGANALPLSQDRQDAMFGLQMTFGFVPILALIALIITALIIAFAGRNQVV
jgi:hypothetical protein